MFSLLTTMRLWGISPRTGLTAYLEPCAANGGQTPESLRALLPWTMEADRLARMRRAGLAQAESIDSS
jgi:hypothetical protein